MSIKVLQQVAARQLPMDCMDDDLRDELLVLRAAGLIAALTLQFPPSGLAPRVRVTRVLAITPDGRRLLRRVASPVTSALAQNDTLAGSS